MFIQQEKPRLTGRAKKHTEPDGVANAWLQLAKAFARHSGSGRILLLKSTEPLVGQHHRLANGHADEVGL